MDLSRDQRIKVLLLAASCCTEQDAHIRNRLLRLVLRSDFGPCRLSRASWLSERTNPRRKDRGFVEISANQGVAPAAPDAHIRDRLLRLARRSDFGRCSLSRSRASWLSERTNPRPKRPWLYRDIRESRSRSCCTEQDAHIRNRLLRLARLSVPTVS